MITCARPTLVFDTLLEMYEKDRANPEFLWVHITEAAILEFDGGRFSVAAEKWQTAYQIAQGFDGCDPRLAASLNNLAIAFRIEKDFEQAARCCRNALENWESAGDWVDGMRLTQRARSSLFHLRLERKHRKKYDGIARRKYQKLLSAGQAGTLNNLAELFHSTNPQDAKQHYTQALQLRRSSMGAQDHGVAVIRENIVCLLDAAAPQSDKTYNSALQSNAPASFLSQAEHHRWVVDRPAEFSDEGRLMAAILLTHILDHRRMCNANLKIEPSSTIPSFQ
jgi:tetratricopeptide (TPR) repeat protein